MIKSYVKTNFETLSLAFDQGQACIMECLNNETGKPVVLICAVSKDPNDKDSEMIFVPFAEMIDGNPFEMYSPPDPNDGDGFIIDETDIDEQSEEVS